ncbi:hypothetical protein Pyn_23603 [Prunus yedoensis var. nudiflora]|uniref:Uncharacterized protein n=1 Tax=Prunus yedoensis var. nudiflora TaxID=2094558 RepID=A0A314V064_PRUYE|nr:hypothetical protein Pyn_23603 [Prunus yedoensis var. nudiflora]
MSSSTRKMVLKKCKIRGYTLELDAIGEILSFESEFYNDSALDNPVDILLDLLATQPNISNYLWANWKEMGDGSDTQLEDGHFYLEDLSASVEINLSNAISFTHSSFITSHLTLDLWAVLFASNTERLTGVLSFDEDAFLSL